MRRAALVLLLAFIPSVAVAQAPPSRTLERAIKLYDKQDYFSSSIEVKKVLEGRTGDSPENVDRAKFFMAKSFYQMHFYAASLAMFQGIITDGGSYRSPSWKWIAALRNHIPDAMLASSVSTMTDADLDDPVLASVRDDLRAIRLAKIPAPADLRAVTRDALGCTHPDPVRMRELLTKLRNYDDNVELVAAMRLALRANDVYTQTLELAMEKLPRLRDARRWVVELRTELELLNRSDRAWQTTMVAAEIMQELTVQLAVGEADLGGYVRQMLDRMDPELATIGSYSTPPDKCSAAAAPRLAGGSTSSPMVVEQKRQGCGCSTGGSPDGALLVGLLAIVLRRKSRAASGTRSPRE